MNTSLMKFQFLRCIGSLCLLGAFTTLVNAQSPYSTTNAFGNLSFTAPVAIVSAPGETNRLFIVEQPGQISVIPNLAIPTRSLFLDISGRVVYGGEQGLLGLAFHPGYATNGYFYVFYTVSGLTRFNRLSRFEVNPLDPNQGMADSEQILINQLDEASNHNGGDLHFGPEGYLYVSLGDEGGGNDNLQNSQRIDKDFFSGILRIDVDKRPGSLPPNNHPASSTNYAVPPDNPFVGATSFNGVAVDPANVITEFWAVGLRNPWRMSFDPDTGRLYCGDVGQNAREEIDVIVRGGNYGWYYREGLIARPGSVPPPPGFTHIDPILDYTRGSGPDQGLSVTGGVVYRGGNNADLFGHYVFGDFISGNIWALFYDGTNTTPFRRLTGDANIAAFGVDPRNGDVLLADLGENRIKRLVFDEPSGLLDNLVPAGAVWKYLDNGSNQGTAWREPGFDDTAWASGPAKLGGGDEDVVTTVNLGPETGRFVTTYFRHAFEVADPARYLGLRLDLLRDDGAMVYLNGQLVFQSNMPDNPSYLTLASTTVGDTEEEIFHTTTVPLAALLPGNNTMAVEVHQSSITSSDLGFDLRFAGETQPTLTIRQTSGDVQLTWPAPAPGYVLQGTPNLDTPQWLVTGEAVVRNGSSNVVTLAATTAEQFYRLARVDPLVLTAGLQSMVVNNGQNITLGVTAFGNSPLTYAWYKDDVLIAGETESTLALVDVQESDSGLYKVVIIDNVGQTAESSADITVLQVPQFVMHPQTQTVRVGEDATFTVTTSGTLPMGYRWRNRFFTVKNEVLNSYTSSFTITNVQFADSNAVITVVVTNAALPTPGVLSQQANLIVLP